MIFADSYYFIALLNDRDPDHQRIVAIAATSSTRIITTEYVMIEVANALAGSAFRDRVVAFVRRLENARWFDVIWSDRQLVEAGLELYARRFDKHWSLTDCISFVVMKQKGITNALTHDHHFKQAGFRVLL